MTKHLSSVKTKSDEVGNITTADIHDKVYDAYYGKLGNAFMHETQRRINWICSQVSGSRVLDIGCSQGISSILLGREGKKVTGIDVDSKAIKEARKHLSYESKTVREKVKFINGDAGTHTFGKKKFDTVIIGEVLEHLINPERLIHIASKLISPNGQLIVTTPFGINDYIDHKNTFYLLEPYKLTSSYFSVTDIKLLGKWLGITAIQGKQSLNKCNFEDYGRRILKTLEDGFLDLEKSLRIEISNSKSNIRSLETKHKSEIEILLSNNSDIFNAILSIKSNESRGTAIESILETSRTQANQEQHIALELRNLLTESKNKIIELSGNYKYLENLLQKERVKLLETNNDITSIKEQLAISEYSRKKLTTEIDEKNISLRNLQSISTIERKDHRLELDALKLKLQKYGVENKTLDNKVSKAAFLENNIIELNNSLLAEKTNTKALTSQLKALTSQLDAERKTNKNTLNTLSFQLGYAIIFGFKSFPAFRSLPNRLFSLRKEALQRRGCKKSNHEDLRIRKFEDKNDTKFISILDEISEESWASEFSLYRVRRKEFSGQISSSNSKALFLESCWKGNGGEWEYAFTSPKLKHPNAQDLLEVIEKTKEKKLPVIFWNKEDPMHYRKFLPIFSKCDIIFTTDSNKVESYQRDIPNAKIGVLPFAANPLLCNPSGRFLDDPGTICFAGSYYSEGHDERKRQMDTLLPVIPAHNGVIYDRMSNLNNPRYAFPQSYEPYLRASVPFKEITNVYKKFKLFLNVNTITDSPTMMSRRVYELLACGTPVISSPSLALENQFSGIVQIAETDSQAIEISSNLLSDQWTWSRLSHKGYREVMLKHTYQDRAGIILSALGSPVIKSAPIVSIIMATHRPKHIDRIVNNISNQTHPNIQVIVVTQKYTSKQVEDLKTKLLNGAVVSNEVIVTEDNSDSTLGTRLNHAISLAKGDYIAKFDDDDLYFPNYLQDALIPFSFGDYSIVGKKEVFIYLEGENKTILRFKNDCHRTTNFVAGPTLVIKRSVFSKIQFPCLNQGEDTHFLESAEKEGLSIYASDPFNFIQWRSKSTSDHTWQVDNNFFLKKGEVIGKGISNQIVSI